jgi:hypothetical protein
MTSTTTNKRINPQHALLGGMIVSMGGSVSEPVKQPEYDPEDLVAIKLAEEQKKAADLAAQTEMIYTRNKEVWKTTNRDILEDHCVKEGLNFSKEAIDAAHARYVAELQAAEEAKAKADAAKEAASKAAEAAARTPVTPPVTPPTTTDPTSTPTSEPATKPLDDESLRLLAIRPRLGEVITSMWDTASLGKGVPLVIAGIERDFKVHLGTLSQEVYKAYQTSKGSDDTLQALIKQHTPRLPSPSTPPVTPPQTPTIPPQGPNSSTNPAQLPNSVPEGVVTGVGGGVTGVSKGGVQDILEIVQRNMKLTDEQAISSFRSEYGTSRV